MKDEKIAFIKDKQIKKKAKENFEAFNKSKFVQNPIDAEFLAFKETKKEIDIKDLF